MCLKQFSLTSGTPWAYRKLPFRKLMYLISSFNHAKQAITSKNLCEDLGVQYKTALVWTHKIRSEIAARAESEMLSGEVEIDGVYVGGHIRPKNLAKTRKDLRKIPYRDNAKALCVVVARERGGAIRTFVTKQEGSARRFIRDSVAADTVIFGDGNPAWGWFRTKFQVFQVNHKQAYSTPEACTNHAESFNAALRNAERFHRHITQNYVDLYAAEVAHRVRYNRKAPAEGFAALMAAMSRPGKSPMTGYYQGRKRGAVICHEDGSTSRWRPPAKRSRANASGTTPVRSTAPIRKRDQRGGMTFISAAEFAIDPTKVPNGPGVYALMFRNGAQLLSASGFGSDQMARVWRHEDHHHLYTGESYGLRGRLHEHLGGSVRSSNFRETLLALQWCEGALPGGPSVTEDGAATEARLTEWLASEVMIGFKTCGYVRDVEAALLAQTASPLNIMRRTANAYAIGLKAKRARLHGEFAGAWHANMRASDVPVRRR
jgi:hypothetical protein